MTNRPCWVEIDTHALQRNFQTIGRARGRSAASPEMLAIVKANAYGHGLEICAPAALSAGARWLGVTSVEEGVRLRQIADQAGFPSAEILVIAGMFSGQSAAVVDRRLTTVVWEPWQLDQLEAAAGTSGLTVHLELDTGMTRQGVAADRLDPILQRLQNAAGCLRLGGIMTHLYAADESDGEVTRQQFQRLSPMVERVFAAGLRPEWLHVGNSAAVLSGEPVEALVKLCERFGLRPMVRPGLALYGLAPAFQPDEPDAVRRLEDKLAPVLSWKTRVVSVKQIAAGQPVGYNGTFVAAEQMQVALLAVGYGDGLRRELSNRGEVLVAGRRAPIVGRVSMDQAVIDVTEIDGVNAGDEVVLIGSQGRELIGAEDHARWAGTIPWEIFTSISSRVERRSVPAVEG